ncbi:MAG: cobP [Ilumatobacteraceae bacterium]|nr:cobP [Ilumatobacteraceae bacterium]MCU1387604.1 cobP [Ilumatobacteraceae bacterium]
MGRLTLLVGGARSGKSDLAVQIGERHTGGVTFVATAQRFDDDMSARISRHQAERPAWPTVEAPVELRRALADVADDDLVIIDCLTLWVSNMMLEEWSDLAVADYSAATADAAAQRTGPTVVVSNEVGLGIHPANELGRQYRDLLGRVNRQWAAAADRSLFLVAGRALPLHDPWELLS